MMAAFETYDGDIIRLRPADGVLADRGQDGLAGRYGSGRRSGQDLF